MQKFKIEAPFTPAGDQPQAIEALTKGLNRGDGDQVLLGVTGSGKTFSIAHVIQNVQRPTLVISHNKTLAAQLYQELKAFFPKNAVEYFVSYYDYYQPEAYLPSTDTYIEKEVEINDEIERMRLSATTSLLTRQDVIVVASVSCIYNIGSPQEWRNSVILLNTLQKYPRRELLASLNSLHYERHDLDFMRASYRVRGDHIDIWKAYEEQATRLTFNGEILEKIVQVDPLTGELLGESQETAIYPAKHYLAPEEQFKSSLDNIRKDLGIQVEHLNKQGKLLEAHRIKQRTEYDLEMLKEIGYCKGVENYSRYFDGRVAGEPPYSLLDFFPQVDGFLERSKKWLLIVDESHMTIPQIGGMYHGDRSRKQMLIDFGFRLPSAIDNRPLRFDEFMRRMPQTIYMSATPSQWEIEQSKPHIVEQLVRPTGLLDPAIEVRKTQEQVPDLMNEIKKRRDKKERVLVTTLTKRMAEELSRYIEEQGIKGQYLHSDVETLERTEILADLRMGKYDVLVGVNLLREGLDLPEVSLVAIMDADKEGFLRSEVSLIQTIGRAARHHTGTVILYADKVTGSMRRAIDETERRRNRQIEYNKKHKITPQSIQKPIREQLTDYSKEEKPERFGKKQGKKETLDVLFDLESKKKLTKSEKEKRIQSLETAMKQAANDWRFEEAAKLRDEIIKLKGKS